MKWLEFSVFESTEWNESVGLKINTEKIIYSFVHPSFYCEICLPTSLFLHEHDTHFNPVMRTFRNRISYLRLLFYMIFQTTYTSFFYVLPRFAIIFKLSLLHIAFY